MSTNRNDRTLLQSIISTSSRLQYYSVLGILILQIDYFNWYRSVSAAASTHVESCAMSLLLQQFRILTSCQFYAELQSTTIPKTSSLAAALLLRFSTLAPALLYVSRFDESSGVLFSAARDSARAYLCAEVGGMLVLILLLLPDVNMSTKALFSLFIFSTAARLVLLHSPQTGNLYALVGVSDSVHIMDSFKSSNSLGEDVIQVLHLALVHMPSYLAGCISVSSIRSNYRNNIESAALFTAPFALLYLFLESCFSAHATCTTGFSMEQSCDCSIWRYLLHLHCIVVSDVAIWSVMRSASSVVVAEHVETQFNLPFALLVQPAVYGEVVRLLPIARDDPLAQMIHLIVTVFGTMSISRLVQRWMVNAPTSFAITVIHTAHKVSSSIVDTLYASLHSVAVTVEQYFPDVEDVEQSLLSHDDDRNESDSIE